CVHNLLQYFKSFEGWIPYIALALLCFIGGKMLFDAIKYGDDDEEKQKLTLPLLLIQAVATSIDALSVGFTIAEYSFLTALVAVCLIMAVTFVICLAGVIIGRKFGTKFAGKAEIAGGIILILIGIEIFISGVFF
ncbi:MAG: manganese efflux pump, partial [Ruminiclostridium sp.]|nr:manganese efflux pump [Ruminiclostridium sp.]